MALVRLRTRSPRVPGADWVTPRGDGRWTTVGNLDSPARAAVDPSGLVAVAGQSWSLDWWIGAEDRWHVPAREAAVRQALVGNSPVVETRVRVPSGDAVERVYAARGPGGEDVLVVEVHNDTKVPFALGLSLRPYGLDGDGRIAAIELDGNAVRVDGTDALVLPRSPGRIALSDADGGDAAAVVFSGAAEPVRSAEVRCSDGLATSAFLFPLAHTATLRVVLPLTAGARVDPAALPSAEQVASGWAVHSRQGARFEVPNRQLRDAIAASTRFLLLGPTGPESAAALDLLGFADEAAAWLVADPPTRARTDRPGATLHALGQHWSMTRDVVTAAAVAPLVGALIARLARTSDREATVGRAALPLVAELLDGAGEALAASDVRALIGPRVSPPRTGPGIDGLLATASTTWTWPADTPGHDLAANAALVTAVRHLLVQELDGSLALCPAVPEAWLGQGWEVHDAPTAHGRLSYAIRWHGERPAVLWDLEPLPGRPPVALTVPGLDPAWSTQEPRGEALLAPVAVPDRPSSRRGLSIPVTIEPMPRRSP
jgi:hypothetical protein